MLNVKSLYEKLVNLLSKKILVVNFVYLKHRKLEVRFVSENFTNYVPLN
jgi:hypothetical protein